MIARIPLIGKLSSAGLPFQSYFVFGHVSYMECGQALGNLQADAKRLARNSAAPGRQTTHGIVFDWQQPHPLGPFKGGLTYGPSIIYNRFRNSSSRSHSIFFGANDIVAHPQLSREMKLALLRQWEQTARSLSVAESEGMGGGEENKLGRVELASRPLRSRFECWREGESPA